jgi:hypothetical protein
MLESGRIESTDLESSESSEFVGIRWDLSELLETWVSNEFQRIRWNRWNRRHSLEFVGNLGFQ